MTQESRNRVPLVLDTVGKCLCPACPVQENSRCVSELKTGMDEALKSNPLKTEEVPGVYCGTGKATCTDHRVIIARLEPLDRLTTNVVKGSTA